MPAGTDVGRYGVIKMNEECRIEDFEEKPIVAKSNTVSCGIYVVRRRQLIEMIEKGMEEERHDFVKDILILLPIYVFLKITESSTVPFTIQPLEIRLFLTCAPTLYFAEGKMKAIVSITLDEEFVVHDIKVIEGEKGLFITS